MAGLQFSVEQILGLIETLTPEQKQELQQKLPTVLGASPDSTVSGSVLNQSMSLGNISFGGGQSNFTFNPQQSGRDSAAANDTVTTPQQAGGDATTNTKLENTETNTSGPTPEMMEAIARLKAAIQANSELNPLAKPVAEEKVKELEAEVQKENPDPSFIQKTVDALKQGLAGVEELAGPTMTVAKIVGAAFLL